MRTRVLAGALLTATALTWAGPAAAQTSSPSLTVTPAEGVAPGSTVTVTGTGFAPGGGIYVQFCERPAGALGTAGGRAATCNPDQGNEHTVWKTPIAANGQFSVQLRVESTFGSTNCSTATCGVFTRKDHMGGQSDFSQDAFTPVTFAAAQAAPTTTAPAPAGGGASAAPTGELAMTGASPWLAAAAAVALGLGGGLVLLTRRREA